MPRDGSGQYTQPFPYVDEGTTIESAVYNGFTADVAIDLNTPRPVVAGGTGASSADEALDNLKAEKFKQVVANWDSMPWRAGSFYAATTAPGIAPVAGHAFAGIVYYANATDLIIEATDLSDPANPTKYIRLMAAGVWGNWQLAGNSTNATGEYVFDATLTYPPAAGQVRFNNASQNLTTEIFISHTTALGLDNTGIITSSLKSGHDLYLQDKDEPHKYKLFTLTANPVLSGSDFRVTATFKYGNADLTTAQRLLMAVSTGSSVSYDIDQNLTDEQEAQARDNIGAASIEDVAKKNYIINGAMQVSQENGNSTVTVVGAVYPVDQFVVSAASTTGVAAGRQIVSAVPFTPGGSNCGLRVTVSTLDNAVAAGDLVLIAQNIEGLRCTDLKFGTADAKTITLKFVVRAPAGTYSASIVNGAATRSFIAEYVISAAEANLLVTKTITIPGCVDGAWATDNTTAITVYWILMAGTTFHAAINTWNVIASSNPRASANQFNFMATGSNVFELADVGLYAGDTEPTFAVPDYATELQVCKRYLEVMSSNGVAGQVSLGNGHAFSASLGTMYVQFTSEMRAKPSFSMSNAAHFGIFTNGAPIAATSVTAPMVTTQGARVDVTVASGLTAGNGVAFHAPNTAYKLIFRARL